MLYNIIIIYNRVFMKSKLSSQSIVEPNRHPIDNDKLYEWLDKSDVKIRSIATEFIMKTTYISYNFFAKC